MKNISHRFPSAILVISITSLIFCVLTIGSVPPTSRDALTHHLAVPKLWIENGGFVEIPSISFSYYPMNLDLLYAIPLYFGNDIIPKYIHFSFGFFTALLMFVYLKKRINTNYGLLGVLFFLSIPVIVKLSTTVYVDLGLIFFTTASLLGLIKWRDKGFTIKTLAISGLWCGLSLGTKYNGLIVFFLLSCFVPFIYLRRGGDDSFRKNLSNQFKALGCGIIFVFVSLLAFSPWMIRNTMLTGNPIYPLYNSFFNTSDVIPPIGNTEGASTVEEEDTGSKNNGWKHFAVRKVVYGESLWQICLIPLRVFFEGNDDDPKHFDGQLSPFLLVLPLLLFLPAFVKDRRRDTEYRILALFSVAYMVFVFFQVDMRIRWISPIIPPLVILSMCGLYRLQHLGANSSLKWQNLFPKGAVVVVVVSMLFLNGNYIHSLYQKVDPISFISGQVDRDDYIKKFRPEYELIRYVNRQLPEDSVILCLFIGNRIYYFDRTISLDVDLLQHAVISSNSIDQIGYNLNSAGITHILLRYDLSDLWVKNNLDPKKQTLVKIFFQKRAKQIHSFGGYGLFELRYIG